MNCQHHIVIRQTDNELICTACSPERAGEPRVDNAKQTVKSMFFCPIATSHPQLMQTEADTVNKLFC
jgi:hypothetical protein